MHRQSQRFLTRALAAGLPLAAGTSCAWRAARTAPPPLDPPGRYASARGTGAAAPERWWTAFGDDALDTLVDDALGANFDLRRAWARLDQARAAARTAGADRAPSLNLEGSARRTETVAAAGPEAGTVQAAEQYALGLAASYELDLWGRVASGARAAVLESDASEADLHTAALTVAAELAQAWFELREQQAQIDLFAAQRETSRTYGELTEYRFGRGLASALDVLQQRQQTASLEALVEPVRGRRRVLEHRVAFLAGRAPGTALPSPAGRLPDPPPLPAPGLPADLLLQRPDVRAAQARLRAADERVASAVAARLPSLRLTAGGGYQSPRLSTLFDPWLWNLAASLVGPLVDGGRRSAEADRARGAREERLADYGQALLRAIREVEDAWALEEQQAAYLARLERQTGLAEETLGQARSRYGQGLTDYLPVLTALERLQALQRTLVSARRQRLAYRVQLYRALGGTWPASLKRPPPAGAAGQERKTRP